MRTVLIAGLLLAFCLETTVRAADEFEAQTFTSAGGKTLPYRVLKPKNIPAGTKVPLVLFMHGAGERGTDNKNQLKNAVGVFAKPEAMQKYPCIVIAPQVPNGQQWVNTPWGLQSHTLPEKPSDVLALTFELIEKVIKEEPVDPARFYVTGISMGGYGVWDFITRKPEMVAAAVPVCGGADSTQAAIFAKIPIWAFHGDKDGVVPTKRSRDAIAAVKAAGGTPKYTEYAGVGHDSWSRAFNEAEFMPWLFAQKK